MDSNNTMDYALSVLNSQRAEINRYSPVSVEARTQRAYYDGMLTMLNIIVSNGFTENRLVNYNEFTHFHTVKG